MTAPVPVQHPEGFAIGDGVTAAFVIGFDLPSASHLVVTVDGSAVDGGGVDYSVAGSEIVFGVAPDGGARLAWRRATPIEQARAFDQQPTMRPKSVEDGLSDLTRIAQDQGARIGRGLSAPIGESLGELPVAAVRANGIMLFDANGAPIVQATPIAWNEIGGDFQDDGPWSGPTAPLTHDDGVFG